MNGKISPQKNPSEPAPLSPPFHDEFVALCATYYSGDISEEEWALLQIHMGYCDSCHQNFLQYQRITSDVIPAIAALAASELETSPSESAKSLEYAEKRLMSRTHSAWTREESGRRSKFRWHLPATLTAACALAAVFLFTIYSTRMKIASAPQEARVIPDQGRTNKAKPNVSNREAELVEKSRQQVAALEQKAAAAESRLNHATQTATALEKKLRVEQAVRKELIDEKNVLNQELAAAQEELVSLQNKLDAVGTDAAQQSARATALETLVKKLRVALDEKDVMLSEKDRMLDLDKDFLSRDRDIRDLVGARNLYIADILDTNENGRTARQFGRIFYTRDRSLIFYGFDLDSQSDRKQDVSFQVWGSGSSRPSPVSLGLFYQDDSHKRWVLRCNDAKTLARLDMVFVTVEPPGGSPKPTGKQLLRAYLQIHPNHP